jgi:membrane protease YdiL (CAAX protease family)
MDGAPRLKLQARTIRTLVFALAFPVWMYFALDAIIRMGLAKFSGPGLLVMAGAAGVGCAAAWLLVGPVQIEWTKWPRWSFGLLSLGYVARAWLLADSHPWPWVLLTLVFYLVVVSLQEEFIFRVCVEQGLAEFGPWTAAVFAGLFFGLAHAPLALLQGSEAAYAVLNQLAGGVVFQLAMRWLRDKGGLAVPVLVHGLLDFLGAR